MVRYSGTLRDDLYLRMQVHLLTRNGVNPKSEHKCTPKNDHYMKACAKKADLVLVIGTSLSGLASDCVPEVRQQFYLLVLPVVVASSKKSNAHI